MAIVGEWHFTAQDGARDRAGLWADLELQGLADLTASGLTLGRGSWALARGYTGPRLGPRTLVAWVRLSLGPDRCGGAPIALGSPGRMHDALALGVDTPWGWTRDSEQLRRTSPAAGDEGSAEGWQEVVQIAVSCGRIGRAKAHTRIFRDGVLIGEHKRGRVRWSGRRDAVALFGPRALEDGVPQGHLLGKLLAAQIHDEALDAGALSALRPPLRRQGAAAPTFALLMGVSDYTRLDSSARNALGTSDLRGALGDVRSMASLVRLMGVPADHVRVLTAPRVDANHFPSVVVGRARPVDMNMTDATMRHATAAEIRSGLAWLAEQLRSHEGAQGIVYFSGHSVVTTSGQLALAAMDTRRGGGGPTPDIGSPQGLGAPDAWWRCFSMSGLVKRVAGVLGTTNGNAVLDAIVDVTNRIPCPVSDVVDVLASHGADTTSRRTRDLLRDLVQMTGVGGDFRAWHEARHWGLTATQAETLLHTDPMAHDVQLDGLVSFLHATATSLFPLPEDRAITFIFETCLSGGQGRTLSPETRRYNVPTAHGNAALLTSCRLGENSVAGVFDNRWSGAFTHALSAVLSQRTVHVTDAGRCFDLSYGELQARIADVLRPLDFVGQHSQMWAQGWVGRWPVFGQAGWLDPALQADTLAPVRAKEEIHPGTTGTIYVVERLNGENLGHLVVTAGEEVPLHLASGTHTFMPHTETWTQGVPSGTFQLARPANPGGDPHQLQSWVQANITVLPASMVVFQSGQFGQGPGGPVSVLGAHLVVKRVEGGGPPGPPMAFVTRVGSGLKWHQAHDGELHDQRLDLSPTGGQPVVPVGHKVVFEERASAGPGEMWVGEAVLDSPM